MVMGVCFRVVRNQQDAEDAFQATFIILVRKAASIASRGLLANWLYGVAYNTALKAKASNVKRQAKEKQVMEMPDPAMARQELWSDDLQALLDQELSRLSEKYRVPIILCDLEGKTRKEAAQQLGCPEGSLSSRLSRAMLAKRLAQRGVTLSGGALAAVLAQNVASASVSISLVSSTIQAATLVAAGKTAAAGVISPKVAALTDGVLKAMLTSKLKAVIAIVLVLGFITTGATVLVCRPATAQDKPAIVKEEVKTPPKQEPEQAKDGFTAWGKEAGGLQAGLGYYPGQKRSYSQGESVKLVVRVRNVGREAVKFQYIWAYFAETPPAVTDGAGKPVPLPGVGAPLGRHVPREVNLAPGKEIELYELKLELRPESERVKELLDSRRLPILYGTGKFQIQYERVFGMSSGGQFKLDPILGKLATGKLELEIKSEPPAENEKKAQPKQEPEPIALMKTMEGFRTKGTDGLPSPLRLMKTMDGFRKEVPPPQGTEDNGFGLKDVDGKDFTMSHLAGVARRLGVKTKAECLVLLTYLKDRDPKIRFIAAQAIESIVHAYPGGMSLSDILEVDSDGHREMIRRFVEKIEKLAT
jgi:RNA polymerase sigma factor (sigma-70 family)